MSGLGICSTGWVYAPRTGFMLNGLRLCLTGCAYAQRAAPMLNGLRLCSTGWAYAQRAGPMPNGLGLCSTGWVYAQRLPEERHENGLLLVDYRLRVVGRIALLVQPPVHSQVARTCDTASHSVLSPMPRYQTSEKKEHTSLRRRKNGAHVPSTSEKRCISIKPLLVQRPGQ